MKVETVLFLNKINEVINHNPFQVLFWLIVLDILTGLSKAIKLKRIDSKASTNGMIRHVIVLLIVVLTSVYGRILGFEWVSAGLGYFYIGSYGISVVENANAIGLPLPGVVTQYFNRMRDRYDNELRNGDVR